MKIIKRAFYKDSDSILRLMALEGLKVKNKLHDKEFISKLNEELDYFNERKLSDTIIVLYDLIFALKAEQIDDFLIQCCLANSLVAYCLGIIDINPIENSEKERILDNRYNSSFWIEASENTLLIIKNVLFNLYDDLRAFNCVIRATEINLSDLIKLAHEYGVNSELIKTIFNDKALRYFNYELDIARRLYPAISQIPDEQIISIRELINEVQKRVSIISRDTIVLASEEQIVELPIKSNSKAKVLELTESELVERGYIVLQLIEKNGI